MEIQELNNISDGELLNKINEYYNLGYSYYAPEFEKMRILDATDSGNMWKALGARFPAYQILPDTNYISYIKSNLLASLYTVTRSAELQPTSKDDKEIITHINQALSRIWELARVGFYQFSAGEWAALTNLGITQVGWDDTLSGGSDDSTLTGCVALKDIEPYKFMRDPFATSFETAGWCMTYDRLHRSAFLNNPLYRKAFMEYELTHKDSAPVISIYNINNSIPAVNKDYYTLLTCWIKYGDNKIMEVHTLNGAKILHKKDEIFPNEFPFALLYSNLPKGNRLIGVSECAKQFANNVAINLMDSLALTAEHKNQHPPKFVNQGSGLNIQTFAKHADDADYTFPVNGDPNKAVYYHEYPALSQHFINIRNNLAYGIQQITGVDDRYTGRDSGSILTTGGVDSMLNRATTIDTPKIVLYEEYTRRLTKLVLGNFLQFGQKRSYFIKNPTKPKDWKTIVADFPSLDKEAVYQYEVNISAELPRTKQRMAQVVNLLMEKQMQYGQAGQQVEFITPEEWLMFQDIPNKEFFYERMGIQRNVNYTEQVSALLFNYANLVKGGMNPDDAIGATAQMLKGMQTGEQFEQAPAGMVQETPQMPPLSQM